MYSLRRSANATDPPRPFNKDPWYQDGISPGHAVCEGPDLILPCTREAIPPGTHGGHRLESMAKIEIYAADYCGFCWRAKALLTARGLAFTEYDVVSEPFRRREMRERGARTTTIPQIFIDKESVGGCDELYALDRSGDLAALIEAQGASSQDVQIPIQG